jgi:PTS system mannitol-specific IIA component
MRDMRHKDTSKKCWSGKILFQPTWGEVSPSRATGLSIVQIPDGVDFGEGQTAYLLVGIAAVGDEHLDILTNVAMICSEEDNLSTLLKADSVEKIIDIFERGL